MDTSAQSTASGGMINSLTLFFLNFGVRPVGIEVWGGGVREGELAAAAAT